MGELADAAGTAPLEAELCRKPEGSCALGLSTPGTAVGLQAWRRVLLEQRKLLQAVINLFWVCYCHQQIQRGNNLLRVVLRETREG